MKDVYLKANPNLLANTLTPDIAQYHLEKNLTASCLHCCSTGFTEREIPMQYYKSMYYTSTKMHTGQNSKKTLFPREKLA